MQNNAAANGSSEDESSFSSFYSSLLKTDEGPSSSNEGWDEKYDFGKTMDKEIKWGRPPIKRLNPHWLDHVDLTNELIYRYQIDARILSDVLKTDLFALNKINQVRTF